MASQQAVATQNTPAVALLTLNRPMIQAGA
jgi:hypothetical protein